MTGLIIDKQGKQCPYCWQNFSNRQSMAHHAANHCLSNPVLAGKTQGSLPLTRMMGAQPR